MEKLVKFVVVLIAFGTFTACSVNNDSKGDLKKSEKVEKAAIEVSGLMTEMSAFIREIENSNIDDANIRLEHLSKYRLLRERGSNVEKAFSKYRDDMEPALITQVDENMATTKIYMQRIESLLDINTD